MALKVHPLLVGEAEVGAVLDVFWSLTKESGKVTVPILAFLIEDGEQSILVDTGMRDPARATDVHRLGPHRTTEDWSIPAQLHKHGIDAEEVQTIVLTHLHYDHAGGCGALPNARIVVQRTELMAAAAPIGPIGLEVGSADLFYDRKDVGEMVDDFWQRVELLEGDEELFPGVHCILYPDTHTPGSQVIYVDTTEHGTIALVGDMIRKVDINADKGIPPGLFYDLEQMRRAMKDIRKRADVIWPAHDPAVWENFGIK